MLSNAIAGTYDTCTFFFSNFQIVFQSDYAILYSHQQFMINAVTLYLSQQIALSFLFQQFW